MMGIDTSYYIMLLCVIGCSQHPQTDRGVALMTTATAPRPAAAATDQQWLADRGIRGLARVGSCIVPGLSGTVSLVRSLDAVTVAWDDGTTVTVSWTAIAPYGYLAEPVVTTAPADQLTIVDGVVAWTRIAA